MNVGPYEIVDELGRGGMGVVYRARRAALKRDFALKVIRAGEDAPQETVARFAREAQAAARLSEHPGIVGVHDIGQADGVAYFAMDLVEGKSLERLIEEGELDVRVAAGYLEQAARALHFAHANGILHRDVKPGNLLVTRDGRVRVADFGLAVSNAADEATARLTRSGAILGTATYMAPEQARGLTLDARADVYALGATLYECMVGRPPFSGGAMYDILDRVLREPPRPPRRDHPALPADLETIALKCLEKDPERRYATAEAVASDLARFLAGEPIAARPPTFGERLARRVRRNPAPWLVAAVAALLVAGLGATLGISALQARARRAAELQAAIDLIAVAPAQAAGRLGQILEREPDHSAARAALARATDAAAQAAHEERAADAAGLLRQAEPARQAVHAQVAALRALERESDPKVAVRRQELWMQIDEAWGTIRTLHAAAMGVLSDAADAGVRTAAAEALATVAIELATLAEREGEVARAARWLAVARSHAGEQHPPALTGDGTLTLDTAPSGATVLVESWEDPDGDGRLTPGTARTLGTTPLAGVALAMGSYRLTLQRAGYADTLVPVFVGRGEAVTPAESVRLLTPAEIGEGWIYVPGGESILGGDSAARSETPRHRRHVDGFLMQRVEVTVKDYLAWLVALLDAGAPEPEVQARCPRTDPDRGYLIEIRQGFVHRVDALRLADDWPVLGVSWDDAEAFIRWFRDVSGLPVRLPTDAEWERAARGADARAFPWGNGFDWGWTRGGTGWEVERGGRRPRNVGRSVADHSPFGVHDLAGSVAEWCADGWPGELRSIRGGDWGGMERDFFRAATRLGRRQENPAITLGFRLTRDLP